MTLTSANPPSIDRKRSDAAAIALLWIPIGTALVAALIVALAFGLVRGGQWMEQRRPPIITAAENGALVLSADLAARRGEKVIAKEHDDGAILEWNDVYGRAAWRVYAPLPGEYDVTLTLACAEGEQGSDVFIRIAGQELEVDVPATGGWDAWVDVQAGRIRLDQRGVYELRIEAASLAGQRVMNLRAVSLVPVIEAPPVVAQEEAVEPEAQVQPQVREKPDESAPAEEDPHESDPRIPPVEPGKTGALE